MFYIVLWTLAQGRLNELMSQIRMQNHFGAVRSEERYNVDADLLREIKQVSRSGAGGGGAEASPGANSPLLFPALEAAAGRHQPFNQRHQGRLGRHQTHRARTQ